MKQVILTLMLFFTIGSCIANEQAYVSDQLEVQFRSGPSLEHKILRMLKSGVSVNILETQESNGYSYVALGSGEQGWILSRYLSRHPIASTQLEANNSKLAEAIEANKNIKAEIKALKSESQAFKIEKDIASKAVQELSEEASRLNEENSRLKSELISIRQASANIILIQNNRDSLQKQNIELENRLQSVLREKQAQDSSTQQNWFIIGVGTLGGGIILGIMLPGGGFRRKNNWRES